MDGRKTYPEEERAEQGIDRTDPVRDEAAKDLQPSSNL